jgi:hypothetical protein
LLRGFTALCALLSCVGSGRARYLADPTAEAMFLHVPRPVFGLLQGCPGSLDDCSPCMGLSCRRACVNALGVYQAPRPLGYIVLDSASTFGLSEARNEVVIHARNGAFVLAANSEAEASQWLIGPFPTLFDCLPPVLPSSVLLTLLLLLQLLKELLTFCAESLICPLSRLLRLLRQSP